MKPGDFYTSKRDMLTILGVVTEHNEGSEYLKGMELWLFPSRVDSVRMGCCRRVDSVEMLIPAPSIDPLPIKPSHIWVGPSFADNADLAVVFPDSKSAAQQAEEEGLEA